MQNMEFGSMSNAPLENVLSRLPATSFASAEAVCKHWNAACSRILSHPKLSSAISVNPLLNVALEEVFEKVMSQPIRPDFVMANVGFGSEIDDVLEFMVKKFGTNTPILVSSVDGILGRDALTNEFREYAWNSEFAEEIHVHSGIILTVGFLPGLKVDVIPLLRHTEAPNCSKRMVRKFVKDIKGYTSSVSGSTSPPAIIIIGDIFTRLEPVLKKLDSAMSTETIIVGDDFRQFAYRSSNASRNVQQTPDAVALVFARDRNKAHGIGNIEFHYAVSNGVAAIGPKLKVASVTEQKDYFVTQLTARREGEQEILGGHQMLEVINEMENNLSFLRYFIGVTREQNCSTGSDKPRLEFHEVEDEESEEEWLQVGGVGIKTGDYFQFYVPNPSIALSSRNGVSSTLRQLKLELDSTVANVVRKTKPFGGLIFANPRRVESVFGHGNVESAPLVDNFPEIPVAGIFCRSNIGRGCRSLTANDRDPYSTVYVLMSYTP